MKNIKKIIYVCVIIILLVIIFFLFRYNKEHKKNNSSLKISKKPTVDVIKNEEWILTNFGDNEGPQMMSFTIEGDKKGLVIIDGGYKDNEEQYNFLMEKIIKNNNVVNAWIVTHFDKDHAGQFVRIAQEPTININKIYVSDFPEDMGILNENLENKDEDEWDIYFEYLSLKLPQKIKVNPNEIYEFIGLKMKVLSSYNNWIDKRTDNLMNNGSIVFKIYGNEENILFTGDIQSNYIGNYLIHNYKDDLKSDYIQVPHHGNNWLDYEFYKIVNPKIAIFPAPDWIINNTNNVSWFTAEEIKNFLEEQGAKILWHNTSPNIINFK